MPGADAIRIQAGDLLRVEEAASLATVQPSTIRAWLTKGKLPRIKLGRLTRVLRSDLEELIRAGRNTSQPSGERSNELEQKENQNADQDSQLLR